MPSAADHGAGDDENEAADTPSAGPSAGDGIHDALFHANRALRREMAIHRALGVPWAVGGEDGTVRWIPPEDLPDLPLEDRSTLPDSSAPPLSKRPRG